MYQYGCVLAPKEISQCVPVTLPYIYFSLDSLPGGKKTLFMFASIVWRFILHHNHPSSTHAAFRGQYKGHSMPNPWRHDKHSTYSLLRCTKPNDKHDTLRNVRIFNMHTRTILIDLYGYLKRPVILPVVNESQIGGDWAIVYILCIIVHYMSSLPDLDITFTCNVDGKQ